MSDSEIQIMFACTEEENKLTPHADMRHIRIIKQIADSELDRGGDRNDNKHQIPAQRRRYFGIPVYIKQQSFEVKSPRDVSKIYHSPNFDNKAKTYLRI
jgi:hypothetical protein